MPAEDSLATALEEIRGRERAATKGPWRVTQGGPGVETAWELPEGYARAGSALPVASMVLTVGKAEREAANARFTAGARSDVPRLLAAVEAALKLAGHWEGDPIDGTSALTEDRDWVRAGCGAGLREAITRALLGEESPDGA